MKKRTNRKVQEKGLHALHATSVSHGSFYETNLISLPIISLHSDFVNVLISTNLIYYWLLDA